MKEPYRKGEQRIHPGFESCGQHREMSDEGRQRYHWAGQLSFEKPLVQDTNFIPRGGGQHGDSGFFDNVLHDWALKFVEHRVADRRMLRLIQKWFEGRNIGGRPVAGGGVGYTAGIGLAQETRERAG
jgi:hypothetical protein